MSTQPPSTLPMRIAYLINRYPAVSHSFIRREILALERLGIEVERIAIRGWDGVLVDPQDVRERERTKFVLQRGPLFLLLATVGQLVRRPGKFFAAFMLATRMAKRSDRGLLFHWVYLAEACVVADWLRARGVRHIHSHFGTNSAEVAMLAGVLQGAGFSITVHGPEEFDRPQAIGLGEKIRRAAFVVGISSFTRSQLYRWVERDHWSKIHVVRCGNDAAFQMDDRARASEARQLVCVGRLAEQKGHLLLLDGMKAAFDRGCVFQLVLAGDGELRPAIETRIRDLGLEAHVRITGWIGGDQVRAELLAARALVLPSFAEGLPVVIMESMVLRRPVITTYVAGIPELVCDVENGWLIPAGDADALADAMIDCLGADMDRLKRMGEDAHERVKRCHDVDTEAGKLARLFREQLPTMTAAND